MRIFRFFHRLYHRYLSRRARRAYLRLGVLGERVARCALEEKGLEFLVSNYRGRGGEIDLVFRDGATLCFVEVKTRHRQPRFHRPADAVTPKKRAALSRTAAAYLKELGKPDIACRFDIVEVVFEHWKLVDLRHWPSAFTPPFWVKGGSGPWRQALP